MLQALLLFHQQEQLESVGRVLAAIWLWCFVPRLEESEILCCLLNRLEDATAERKGERELHFSNTRGLSVQKERKKVVHIQSQALRLIEVVLVVLVLLNMVLAILMDAYGVASHGLTHVVRSLHVSKSHNTFEVVKSNASVMMTVPQQMSEMLRRRRLNREKKTDAKQHCLCLVLLVVGGSWTARAAEVRLKDIWFAYLEQFQSMREMFESEARQLEAAFCTPGVKP